MPKLTYFKLNEEKRTRIYNVLLKEFEDNFIKDVTIKHLVEELHIPRGSFYQYFESLNESYFYVLDQETKEIHGIFLELVAAKQGNVLAALDDFGNKVAEEIFNSKHYKLYRNRYLFFDADLEKQWRAYQLKNTEYENTMKRVSEHEKVVFIRTIMHSLIQRLFAESWDKDTFFRVYYQYVEWMKEGIGHDASNGITI